MLPECSMNLIKTFLKKTHTSSFIFFIRICCKKLLSEARQHLTVLLYNGYVRYMNDDEN